MGDKSVYRDQLPQLTGRSWYMLARMMDRGDFPQPAGRDGNKLLWDRQEVLDALAHAPQRRVVPLGDNARSALMARNP